MVWNLRKCQEFYLPVSVHEIVVFRLVGLFPFYQNAADPNQATEKDCHVQGKIGIVD
jgi:hypothetical protein